MAANHTYEAGENRRDPAGDEHETINQDTGERTVDLMSMFRDAYRAGRDYFDSNIRGKIEANIANYQSRHPPGSKYYSQAYKHRAKGFRPKTRSMVNRREAQAAVAMFSTDDVVTVKPTYDDSVEANIRAEIAQECLQWRLKNSIKWFQTALGAYQDATVTGVCISHQQWRYREADVPLGSESTTVVTEDTPDIELRPIENVLFSPAADWRDPIGTSPYIIDEIPMTVGEVIEMMSDTESRIEWLNVDKGAIRAQGRPDSDTLRNARNNGKEDPTDQKYLTSEFMTVWVKRFIVRIDGLDWLLYVAGDTLQLCEPILLRDEYRWLKPGDRPYRMGFTTIETHKTYPDSPVSIIAPLQREANDIANQRRDNVALALNRRWFIRKGSAVDKPALSRNVPGSVVEVTDINTDVKAESQQDVTRSSYEEQDRINMDMDDITGSFSGSTVGSARNLNETVGGMGMMRDSADEITEYPLRLFVETWVKPVLKQCIEMIQALESDKKVLQIAAVKAGIDPGVAENVTPDVLDGEMSLDVNVGFGATSPRQRVEKLAFGLDTMLRFMPQLQVRLNEEEISKEVFGSLGYSGADRFLLPADQVEQPQGQEDPNVALQQAKLELEREVAEAKMVDSELERRNKLELAYIKQEETLAKMYIDEKINKARYDYERQRLRTERQNKVDEMKVRIATGAGI